MNMKDKRVRCSRTMVLWLGLLLTSVFAIFPALAATTDNSVSSRIDGVVGLNYYVDEAEADIYFQIGSGNTASGWTIAATVNDVTYSSSISEAGEHFVSLPLASFAIGSHAVDLAVLDEDGNVKWSGTDEIVIRKPPSDSKTPITQIDQNRRIMLIDGNPFFPIGVFGVNNDINKDGENNLSVVSRVGFNTTMRWKENTTRPSYDRSATVAENKAVVHDYLDAVHEAGLYAFEAPVKLAEEDLYEGYDDSNDEWDRTWRIINSEVLPGVVELAKNHPAVIGYYSYDEPDNRYECCPSHHQYKLMQEGVEDFYARVKSADPYHAVLTLFAVGLSKNQDWSAWDIPARNYYPSATTHMSQVYRSVKDSADVAERMHQPYLVTPLFENSSGRAKPLNAKEQRAQTYLSLIGGAKGLLYWEWPAAYDDNWSAIKQLVSEINAIEDVLLERDPEQYYEYAKYGTENSVRALIKNHGGSTYLIIANAENANVNVTYGLPSRYNGSAEVLFDGGHVDFSNGTFSELLGPYERRVYRFNNIQWNHGDAVKFDISVGATQAVADPILNDNPSKNYVKNGDFAYSYGSAPGWPMNWNSNDTIYDSGETGSESGRWAIDENVFYTGGQSLRLHKHFPGLATGPDLYTKGHAPNLVQSIAIPSTGDYQVSFYAKAENPNTEIWIFLNGYEASGKLFKKQLCQGEVCQWERVVLPFNAESTNLHLRIILRGEGRVWIDAVQVEQGTVATQFVDEGVVADKQPPEAPAEPAHTEVTDTSIAIQWVPPSDNSGAIREYQVFNNGALVATTNLLAYRLTGLVPDTTYSDIRVAAVDVAGNVSALSKPLAERQGGVTTLSASAGGSTDFSDNFENGADNWTAEFGSSWGLSADGGSQVLSQTDTSSQSGAHFITAGDSSWTDYTVSADVRKTAYHSAGIAGRVRGETQYYTLRTSTNTGQWLLEKVDGGNHGSFWTVLASGPYSFKNSEYYNLKLEFKGSTINAYINGELVGSADDSSFSSGKIGLRTMYSAAHFDNVVVTDSAATPPANGNEGALLSDGFESGADNWATKFGSSWALSTDNGSHVYSQTDTSAHSGAHLVTAGDSSWADYTVSADVRKTAYHSAGIAGRVAGDTQYYTLRTSTNTGQWLLEKVDGGNHSSFWTVLASGPYSFKNSQYYNLKLEFKESTINAYINGELVGSAEDSSFSSGKIGLRTMYSAAHFDNVVVGE